MVLFKFNIKMLRKVPIVVILGSTGTGKTKLSLEIAEKFGGEIISADSMQVYPNLNIVTAKATEEEQRKAKHHLLNVADPKDSFNVLNYRNIALPIINDLLNRNKMPIVVGGTNYYIESLLWNVLTDPLSIESSSQKITTDKEKEAIEHKFEGQSSEILYDHLKQVDPVTAVKLHPNNKRKIIRALEVFYKSSVPLSNIIEKQRKEPGGNRLGGPLRFSHTIILWLSCDQEVLNVRLKNRVNSMLKEGLITELRDFYEKHVKNTDKEITKGILQTIGLKEFLPYLEKYDSNSDLIIENYLKSISYNYQETPESNEPDEFNILRNCINDLKTVTIRYSKKQLKWINNRMLGYKDRTVPPIYKLNTSNVELWNGNVYEPAINIIESYINDSKSNIEPLKSIIHPSSGLNEEVSNICMVCKRHFVGEFQWKVHLKSNKHKKAKESLKKRKILNK